MTRSLERRERPKRPRPWPRRRPTRYSPGSLASSADGGPAPFIAPYLHFNAPIGQLCLESPAGRRAAANGSGALCLAPPPASTGSWRGVADGRGPQLGLRATPAGEAPEEVVTPESCGSGCACFPPYPELGSQVSCADPFTHCSVGRSHLLHSRMVPAERSAGWERARSGEGGAGPVKSAVSRPAGSGLGWLWSPGEVRAHGSGSMRVAPCGSCGPLCWNSGGPRPPCTYAEIPAGRGSRPAGIVAPPGSLVVPPPLLFLPLSASRPP